MRVTAFGVVLILLGPFVPGCGSTSPAPTSSTTRLDGVLFGQPFAVGDVLLAHPQNWKSSALGSTAILISDTPDLCAQITAGKTRAPGRLLIVRLEQRDANASVVPITEGSFAAQAEGAPSSRYGDVYASAVDASCMFTKLFSDQVQIVVTSVGTSSGPVTGSFTVHYANGESLNGNFSAVAICDETAVDTYLNRSPICG